MTETKTIARKSTVATKATPAKATAKRPAPAKAPAKKAPAKAVPATTTTAAAGPKLRWLTEQEHKGGKNQSARVGDRVYAIKKTGDAYTATVTVDGGKPEVLSDTTFAKAYGACVQHNRAQSAGQSAA